ADRTLPFPFPQEREHVRARSETPAASLYYALRKNAWETVIALRNFQVREGLEIRANPRVFEMIYRHGERFRFPHLRWRRASSFRNGGRSGGGRLMWKPIVEYRSPHQSGPIGRIHSLKQHGCPAGAGLIASWSQESVALLRSPRSVSP